MNITTKYTTTTTSGAGRIVAKAGGKQLTMPYDPARSVNYNHGAAAGLFILQRPGVLPLTPSEFVERIDEGKVTHMGFNDGTHRFEF